MFDSLKKYYITDKKERRILIKIFVWLIFAFFLVRMVPFSWFNKLLGVYKKETDQNLRDDHLYLVSIVQKSIRRLKKRLPWKIKCFEEAIAVKKVLEKHKIESTIYLGVTKRDKEKLGAHAWLKSGNIFITGEKEHKKHAVVGFYT